MSKEPLTLDHLRAIYKYLGKRGLPTSVHPARVALTRFLDAGEPYKIVRLRPSSKRIVTAGPR